MESVSDSPASASITPLIGAVLVVGIVGFVAYYIVNKSGTPSNLYNYGTPPVGGSQQNNPLNNNSGATQWEGIASNLLGGNLYTGSSLFSEDNAGDPGSIGFLI